MRRVWRVTLRVALATAAAAVSLVMAEAALRRHDGLPLTMGEIPLPPPRPGKPDARDTADLAHLADVPLAPGVDPAWYTRNPPDRSTETPWVPDTAARAEKYRLNDPIGAFFVWNHAYLRRELCAGTTIGSLGILDEFYTFDAPDGGVYPIYRHLPYVHAYQWFVPNRYGFRGPDIAPAKPAGTIRIGFLGASTTVGQYGFPRAHTEILEHWLNLWMQARGRPYRIEVINAARTGVDIQSLAAALEQELLPLEPDLVVYYEGANSFRPGQLLEIPRGLAMPGPRPNITFKWRSEYYSALARRVRPIVDVLLTDEGREPPKPGLAIKWPEGVDEQAPDVTRPLPMYMQNEVAQFERMRRVLAAEGGTLGLASFVWMVEDGLRLTLPRDLELFNFLNSTYFPLTYAQLRRAADFQNRVFERFTTLHGLPFFDVDRLSPRDPLLFGDAIHMTQQGMRLQAWIYLQLLAPWIEREVDAGRLPRPARRTTGEHPFIPAGVPPMVTRAEIMASCK